VCPACRGRKIEPVTLSRRGRVTTSTVVRTPPDDLQMEAPYAVALVETPEGARFMTQVVDCAPEDVGPGMEVSMEFRLIRREGKAGIRCYGHKAVPVP
jgi:uncharacterized OB-fold protein